MSTESHTHQQSKSGLLLMALGALGVVYGDIGTSPLYAIKEIFFNHHSPMEISSVSVLGAISLVFWAVTLIVSFKYIVFVLRADNDGEGGVFALYSLLHHLTGKSALFISALLVFAAGLLFGDGVITPAISVISAIEGLSLVTSSFEPLIVPITIGILTGLFAIQSRGTAKIGAIFGPIMLVWFAALGIIGFSQIVQHPEILMALNPLYAFNFLMSNHLHQTLLVLGSVMLVVTGGEAMYADMGHFGRSPIRLSWFVVAMPALLLNYFGQGAYLLSGQEVLQENLFFSLVPSWGLIPMVILATMATIIASQALITGAFSLATQAINLKLLPFTKVVHTHESHEGQIYVPFINWALYVGCIALVLAFKSSSNMAAAYGLAVSGVMLVTTLGMIQIAIHMWKWPVWKSLALFVPLALVDASFLTANSLKFLAGGFVPVVVAVVLYVIMRSWLWGQKQIVKAFENYSHMTIEELVTIKKSSDNFVDKAMIFMSYNRIDELTDKVPVIEQSFWDRLGVLPKHLIFLHIHRVRRPHVHSKAIVVNKFMDDRTKGSIIGIEYKYGFMQEPNIDGIIKELVEHKDIPVNHDPSEWLIHVPQTRILLDEKLKWKENIKNRLYSLLANNSTTQDQYWGLDSAANVTVQVIPVHLKNS